MSNHYRTPDERRERDQRIAERLLSNHAVADRALMREFGTSLPAVAHVRKGLEEKGAIPQKTRRVLPTTTARCEKLTELFARGNSITQAAAALNIGERALRYFMRRHHIDPPAWARTRIKSSENTMSIDRAILAAVNGIAAAAHGLSFVNVSKSTLDVPQVRELAAELRRALDDLKKFQRALDVIALQETAADDIAQPATD